MTDAGRFDIFRIWPPGMRSLLALEGALDASDLPARMLELVRIRASQMNACGFCLELHVASAVDAGEDVHRLALLSAWRESVKFTDQERAALALTEEITECRHGVSDRTLGTAGTHFSATQLAQLSYAVAAINAWNRLAAAGRVSPPHGSHE